MKLVLIEHAYQVDDFLKSIDGIRNEKRIILPGIAMRFLELH